MDKRRTWTDNEVAFLTLHYKKLSETEIARKLDKTRSSINHKKQELRKQNLIDYQRVYKEYPKWTKTEDKLLINNYTDMTSTELQKIVKDRTVKGIEQRIIGLRNDKNVKGLVKVRKLPEIFIKTRKERIALWYIIGVLYGDGSIGYSKRCGKRHNKYWVRLPTIDKEFAERFKNAMEDIFPITFKIREDYNHKKTQYVIRNGSKDVYSFLIQYKSIDIIKSLKKEYKIEILRGIFDSEGYVGFRGKNKECSSFSITITQAEKSETNEIINHLLKFFNLKHYVSSYTSNTQFGSCKMITYVFVCHNGIALHNLLGKFTIERKERNYKEYEKQPKRYFEAIWNPEEINLLKENYKRMSIRQLSNMLKKKFYSVMYNNSKFKLYN